MRRNRFLPIGYYNNAEDIKSMLDCDADTIVANFNKGIGEIHTIDRPEDETAIEPDEELDDTYLMTSDARYIVHKQKGEPSEGNGDCGIYYDIYRAEMDNFPVILHGTGEMVVDNPKGKVFTITNTSDYFKENCDRVQASVMIATFDELDAYGFDKDDIEDIAELENGDTYKDRNYEGCIVTRIN